MYIDTQRHWKVGLRASDNLPQSIPTSLFGVVEEDCRMLSILSILFGTVSSYDFND